VRLFLPARVAFPALTQERCDRPSGLGDPTRCHLMCGRICQRPHRPDSGSGCFVYLALGLRHVLAGLERQLCRASTLRGELVSVQHFDSP
jgi:hypothetical protein